MSDPSPYPATHHGTPPPKKRSIFLWPFYGIWWIFNWAKKILINLFFIFIIAMILAGVFGAGETRMPDNAPLLIAPHGALVDQYSYQSPTSLLLDPNLEGENETRVKDLIDVIDKAAFDERVTGIVLQLDHLTHGGLSKMQEVGTAIERFQATGKPVIAMADSLSQSQYFLAAYADEIILNNLGTIELMGFGLYRNYYKDAIDKLALNFHVFKAGQFKDFIEPYVRNDMSEASREHNAEWINAMWDTYTNHVEFKRALNAGEVDELIANLPTRLEETGGDAAQLALRAKLVDRVGSRIEVYDTLRERFGEPTKDQADFLHIPYQLYLAKASKIKDISAPNIGLIVASGVILDGYQPDGTIGSDSLSELIQEARQDNNIKALVLRVDSGGGSAFASEVIRQELKATRDQGKPVIISMGSVAASGGYWLAMGANEIWATPSTITGSIGVFGFFPTAEQSLAKLGIYTDGIGTTELAGSMRIDRDLPEKTAQVIQQGVESIYGHFIQLVSDSRKMSPAEVDAVAQGRVWTGQRALELGLVDKLGGLNDAINAAAQAADVGTPKVKLIERALSPAEQFVKTLQDQAMVYFAPTRSNDVSTWVLSFMSKLGQQPSTLPIGDALANIQKGAAQRNTYALCLACDSVQ